jgi:hypothetical protein
MLAGVCAGILSLGGVGATAIASTSSGHVKSAVPVAWSGAKTIEPSGGYPSAIACPTASFCAEVDLSGDVATKVAGSWSAPKNIDGAPLVSVSCATSSLCIAIDAGSAYVFNGSTWVKHLHLDSEPMTSISCAPSGTTCIAVDTAGRAVRYSAGAWSSPTPVAAVALDAVSCASNSVCTAVDAEGNAYTYLGAWTAPAKLTNSSLTSVSCPTIHNCFAGADSGVVFVETNGTWTNDPGVISEGILALSCSSTTSCAALGGEGQAATLSGSSWSGEAAVFPSDRGVSVSCVPGGASCSAITYAGNVRIHTSGWGLSTAVDSPPGRLTGVGCGSAKFCVAVDNNGDAFNWNGSGWSAPHPTGLASASGVSCSGAFCVAVSVSGDASIYRAGAWGHRSTADVYALTAVSCATATYCAAVDAQNRVLIYDGTSWAAPSTEGVQTSRIRGYTAVSCAPTKLCVAVETDGNELFFGPGVGSPSTPFLKQADVYYEPLTAVACANTSICVAFDEQGSTITYTASGVTRNWTVPVLFDTHRFTSAACTSVGYCLGMDDAGGYAAYYAHAWSKGTHAPLGANVAVSCAGRSTCVAVNATQGFASTSPL